MEIYLLVLLTIIIFVALFLWKPESNMIPYAIAKAWWPVWDTSQIGVQLRKKVKKSFKTTFIQKGDYVSALDGFQKGRADAATLTIYEAILAVSKPIFGNKPKYFAFSRLFKYLVNLFFFYSPLYAQHYRL